MVPRDITPSQENLRRGYFCRHKRKELINKIESYGLENLVNEIINDFPQILEKNMFKILITKLLTVNISLIKEKLLHNKIKLLK